MAGLHGGNRSGSRTPEGAWAYPAPRTTALAGFPRPRRRVAGYAAYTGWGLGGIPGSRGVRGLPPHRLGPYTSVSFASSANHGYRGPGEGKRPGWPTRIPRIPRIPTPGPLPGYLAPTVGSERE